jgi:hypothetical protein
MKAHKVPATYYSAWRNPATKHSFYVFYKDEISKAGHSKKFEDMKTITQEHSYFMAEDFYYLDISKTPGLLYKLENEVTTFLSVRNYDIKCCDNSCEDKATDYPEIDIVNYSTFMRYHDIIDTWVVHDKNDQLVSMGDFKNDLNTFIFAKIGKIIEENYFAHELEPKWNIVRAEVNRSRSAGDEFHFENLSAFLEFFVIQYLRVDDVIEETIQPIVDSAKAIFELAGYENDDIERKDGLLSANSYFYGTLLDAARGNKKRLQRYMEQINDSYIIDLLHSPSDCCYITSTSPCVVSKMVGAFKSEMLFPVSPQFCVRLVGKKYVEREGTYFEQTEEEVRDINRIILDKTNNIVMSDHEYITDFI